MTRLMTALAFVALLTASTGAQQTQKVTGTPEFVNAMTNQKIPPDWYAAVQPRYDTSKPWSEARLEIRRLLGINDPQKTREAVKLTCLYSLKNDINDGHELPMYLFMGGEAAWAIVEYESYLARVLKERPQGYTEAFVKLSSCYSHFGEYDRALATMERAIKHLPAPPHDIGARANIENHRGDIYGQRGDIKEATKHYRESIRLFPTAKPQFGRHLLKRRAQKVERKLARLQHANLDIANLRDGSYTGMTLGYAKDLTATVKIRGGRIADVSIKHFEKIDLGATKTIPKQIIAKQSLEIDSITGATVTCEAIVDATHQALLKAGMK